MELITVCHGAFVIQDTMKVSDWIAIVNIVVTTLVGLWIGISVRRNFTINRAVKDYFILECLEIKKGYSNFLNCLYQNSKSSKSIIEWLKIMTIKIDIFEEFLKEEFKVNPQVLKTHNKLKQYITETEEFNDNYKSPNFELTPTIKKNIIEIHEGFSKELTKIVIEINKASKSNNWKKKKK